MEKVPSLLGGWELSLSEPGVCQGAGWSHQGLEESGTESGTQHLGSKRLGRQSCTNGGWCVSQQRLVMPMTSIGQAPCWCPTAFGSILAGKTILETVNSLLCVCFPPGQTLF